MSIKHIANKGPQVTFTFEGKHYVAYTRTYSNGDIDIETYLKDNEDVDVSEEAQEYAWNFLESIGLI